MSLIRKRDGSNTRALLTEQDFSEFTSLIREAVRASGTTPDSFISQSGKARIDNMLRSVIEPARRDHRFVARENVTGMERLHDRNACALVEGIFDKVAAARDDLDIDTTRRKPALQPGAVGNLFVDMWLRPGAKESERGV